MASVKRHGKDTVEYWKSRLIKLPTTLRGGEKGTLNEWFIRLQSAGKREYLPTGTANREKAATRARELYQTVLHGNMDDARFRYSGRKMIISGNSITVGQFLEEVGENGGLMSRTLNTYSVKFRTMISEVFKIPADDSRYDYVNDGNSGWKSRVEAVLLSGLTPVKVERWKNQRVKPFERNPLKHSQAMRTVNTVLRAGRSLFAPDLRRKLSLKLTDTSPFDGVKNFQNVKAPPFRSNIDPQMLFEVARSELKFEYPESYMIFVFALGCGLRVEEIDCLIWDQINQSSGEIDIRTTRYFKPKTKNSENTVAVDPMVLKEILESKAEGMVSPFVVAPRLKFKPERKKQGDYRTLLHLKYLKRWLRAQGITAQKPIHELRKLFGKILVSQAGIYAASRQLRHADIQVTTAHYADIDKPAVASFDALKSGTLGSVRKGE